MSENDEDTWLNVSTACPKCGFRHRLQARWTMIYDSPQGAVSGSMPKVTTHYGWWLRCTAGDCGWQGEGALK